MKVIQLTVFQVILFGYQTLAVLRYCNEPEEILTSETEIKKMLHYKREAELMALESTGSLLPDSNLVKKITYDMKIIRSNYPAIANISHRKKWSVGKLRFQNIDAEDILKISESEYGPVKIRQLNPRYRAVETAMNITYITFSKPYHPIVLAEKIAESFGILGEPIRSIFQDGDDTLYMHTENGRRDRDRVDITILNGTSTNMSTNTSNNGNSTVNSSLSILPATTMTTTTATTRSNAHSAPTVYTFIRGKGKCFISCENKRYWHFMVQCINHRNLDVTLLQEYSVNLKTASSLSSLSKRAIRK